MSFEETRNSPVSKLAAPGILTYEVAVQKGYGMLDKIEELTHNPSVNRRAIMTRAELLQEGWIIREPHRAHWSVSSEVGFLVDHLEEDLDYYQNHGRLFHVYSPDHCCVTYSNILCPDGTVIAVNNIKGDGWEGGAPFWSDIVWAMARYLGFPVTKIWRCHVQNENTQAMIDQVLSGPGSEGLFRFPQEEAAALLGTANGMGVGWLVADHLDAFPNRRLKDVLAILGNDNNDYYLRFQFCDRQPARIGHTRVRGLRREADLQVEESEGQGSQAGEDTTRLYFAV